MNLTGFKPINQPRDIGSSETLGDDETYTNEWGEQLMQVDFFDHSAGGATSRYHDEEVGSHQNSAPC
jgi:hypothetical protein